VPVTGFRGFRFLGRPTFHTNFSAHSFDNYGMMQMLCLYNKLTTDPKD